MRYSKLILALCLSLPVLGQVSSSTASHIRYVSSLPATCALTTGDVAILTTGNTGLYVCGPTANNWRQIPYAGSANVFSALNTFTDLKLSSGKIYPSADGTTALGFYKADGTTSVLNVDTTNGRVGIGTTGPG